MPSSDVDPRLVRLLKASLGLVDALRDSGVAGDIAVRLNREGGLSVLKLVAGSDAAGAEAFSQRNRPVSHEVNSLAVAGLTFHWPRQDRRLDFVPVNDNGSTAAIARAFEEDTPALR